MKSMRKRSNVFFVLGHAILVMTLSFSCGDEDKEPAKTIPVINTSPMENVTATTATASGTVTADGNSDVTEVGFVYSSVVAVPTIADSKVTATAINGVFSATLANLTSGTTYHVRAYAKNSVGTGYGDVLNFTTGNQAPAISAVSITGQAEVGVVLSVEYNYVDLESDVEGESVVKWYIADDAVGTGEVIIDGSVDRTYEIQTGDLGKYIRVGIMPKALTGTPEGLEVKSAFIGAIGEPTTVTFTYDGSEVTYGILNSATTGRKWLDRNLGAGNVASMVNDYDNYGDLFQWGRRVDGHQTITRKGPTDADVSGVGYTVVTSSTDTPTDELFIIPDADPFDWRNPKNDNLWQGVNGINNPCPSGWHIPTRAEWDAETIVDLDDAFEKLKLTNTGFRLIDGNFYFTESSGAYWTSSIGTADPNKAIYYYIDGTMVASFESNRSMANACRCIKD